MSETLKSRRAAYMREWLLRMTPEQRAEHKAKKALSSRNNYLQMSPLDRAKKAAASTAWHKLHPEYGRKYSQTYALRHPEYRREYARRNRAAALKRTQDWRRRNPDAVLKSRLKSRYGITVADYQELFASQKGRCAICGIEEHLSRGHKLHLDHHHATNQIRGLLCIRCNVTLGQVEENTGLLRRMTRYLEEHRIKEVA